MNNLFRSLLLCVATAGSLALGSCSKKEDAAPVTPPAASPGTIDGSISPAGAITTVTATSAGGQATTTTPNASTGAYSVPGLAAGTYSLSFAPAAGYAAPAARTGLGVTAGQSTAAGTTVVSRTTSGGTFTWTEGGSVKTATVQNHILQVTVPGTYSLILNATVSAGAGGTDRDQITLNVQNIQTAGTYTFGIIGVSQAATALFLRARGSGPDPIWGIGPGIGGGLGSGSITFTSFNPTARTAAGTFSFVGGPVSNTGTVNTVTVTNGSFNVTIP